MKILSKLVKWSKNKYRSFASPHLKIEMVSEFPSVIKKRTVFVVKDGDEADTLIFKCPCGCNADIYLNLLKDAKPQWDYYLTNREEITVYPSIWRTTGCMSHFFIQKGKVVWASSRT